jgi:aspartate aminotransferase-like enzyme
LKGHFSILSNFGLTAQGLSERLAPPLGFPEATYNPKRKVTMPGIVKERLFTPGPTPLLMEAQARTLAAANVHHRTEAFRKILSETLALLKYYYDTQNDVLIFASSGTGAMEGSIANLLSPGDRILVGTAGKFGERWLGLAQAYGIEAVKVESPYGQPVDISTMQQKLASDGPFRAVFIQATETSTAVMNDVQALGEAVKNYPETVLVVDAITGLGTSDLRIQDWGLDIVIGGSQKAVMIPPGLAFASVSEKAWSFIAKSRLPRYYFDFAKERKNQAKGETAYTPATTLIIGLHAALEYIKRIGRENLIANAALLAEGSRAAAQALGLKLFAESCPANAATAICAPSGMDSGAVVKELRTRFGAIIANGQGSMKGQIFRLAHLGYFDMADLFAVFAALEIVLLKLGQKVELGSGVRAVQETYLRHAG